MSKYIVYFYEINTKSIIEHERYNTLEEAKNNLLTCAKNFVKAKEGENHMDIAIQKDTKTIIDNLQLRDALYIILDNDIPTICQKVTDNSGYFITTYDAKKIGHFLVKEVDISSFISYSSIDINNLIVNIGINTKDNNITLQVSKSDNVGPLFPSNISGDKFVGMLGITPTTFVVVYTTSKNVYLRMYNISGTTITEEGDEVSIEIPNNVNVENISLSKLNNGDKIGIFFVDIGSDNVKVQHLLVYNTKLTPIDDIEEVYVDRNILTCICKDKPKPIRRKQTSNKQNALLFVDQFKNILSEHDGISSTNIRPSQLKYAKLKYKVPPKKQILDNLVDNNNDIVDDNDGPTLDIDNTDTNEVTVIDEPITRDIAGNVYEDLEEDIEESSDDDTEEESSDDDTEESSDDDTEESSDDDTEEYELMNTDSDEIIEENELLVKKGPFSFPEWSKLSYRKRPTLNPANNTPAHSWANYPDFDIKKTPSLFNPFTDTNTNTNTNTYTDDINLHNPSPFGRYVPPHIQDPLDPLDPFNNNNNNNNNNNDNQRHMSDYYDDVFGKY